MKPLIAVLSALLLFSSTSISADDHKKPKVKDSSMAQHEQAKKDRTDEKMKVNEEDDLKQKLQDHNLMKDKEKHDKKLSKVKDKARGDDDDAHDQAEAKGLEKQREKKAEQPRNEVDKGSEKGQEKRAEKSKKWWKFWE